MSLVAQTPTWLPDVEANPKPSPYADLIRMATEAGREHWKIWHLFAFRPEITEHLARFAEGVIRAEAPISAGLRELIATYVSYTNECEFCWRSHAPVAAETGLSLGSVVTTVTRSGTNTLHGGAYEYFRNNAVNEHDLRLELSKPGHRIKSAH